MIELKECETIFQKAMNEGRSSLSVDEALKICDLHRIPTPRYYVTTRADEALVRARELGFPVVLKIISPLVLHKSDVGGVVLDINDEKALENEYGKLLAEVGRRAPLTPITGVLVEKMMPPSTEVIIGGIRDSQFGPSVMFGMGGILTEVFDDAAFRVAPIDRTDALSLVHELKGTKILEGIRGNPPADLDSIVNLLINVSDLMMEHEAVSQLDLNPVIAYPDGVCAVDSRIIVGRTGGGL